MQYHGEVKVKDEVVFTLEGALGPMLPMQDFIGIDTVKRQWQEINRPGDWPAIVDAQLVPNTSGSHCSRMVFDKIIENEPGVKIVAQKLVTRAAPYFADHFPYKPVLPLTVLLECQMNLVRDWMQDSAFKIEALRKIKMSAFVYPGDIVTCFVTVKRRALDELILACRCEVDGARVCVLEVVLRG